MAKGILFIFLKGGVKMKFKVKIEYEEEVEAKDEIEASEKFWESKNDIQTNVDNFIDEITTIEEIKE